MADKTADLVQGTLDMLILKTLALEAMHGYGIAIRIEQISKGVFQVNPGSLFPAFRRLERSGWIKSEWRATENSRRAKRRPSDIDAFDTPAWRSPNTYPTSATRGRRE